MLFRGFELARSPKSILLGTAGALLMYLAWFGIGALMIGERPQPPEFEASKLEENQKVLANYNNAVARYQLLSQTQQFPWKFARDSEGKPIADPTTDPYRSPYHVQGGGWASRSIPTSAFLVLKPIQDLHYPISAILWSNNSTLTGILLTLATLIIWALFGGAITRIAAVRFARDTSVGFTESIRFVLARYMNYVGAPLLPFVGMVFIAAIIAIGGLLTAVPGLNVLMGALWVLALLFSFIIAFLVVGLVAGWPLMYSALSAEATENFDAISRAYSYVVLERPLRYVLYVTLAALYGAFLMVLITLMAYLLVHVSKYAVGWGLVPVMGQAHLDALYQYVPEAGGWRQAFGPAGEAATLDGMSNITALLIGFWTHAVFLGMIGFAYSFFWSEMTIIYFLLRRDVDETDLDEVYVEEDDGEPLPALTPVMPPPSDGGSDDRLPVVESPRA